MLGVGYIVSCIRRSCVSLSLALCPFVSIGNTDRRTDARMVYVTKALQGHSDQHYNIVHAHRRSLTSQDVRRGNTQCAKEFVLIYALPLPLPLPLLFCMGACNK